MVTTKSKFSSKAEWFPVLDEACWVLVLYVVQGSLKRLVRCIDGNGNTARPTDFPGVLKKPPALPHVTRLPQVKSLQVWPPAVWASRPPHSNRSTPWRFHSPARTGRTLTEQPHPSLPTGGPPLQVPKTVALHPVEEKPGNSSVDPADARAPFGVPGGGSGKSSTSQHPRQANPPGPTPMPFLFRSPS